jgi:hypothetical protein
VGGHELLDHFGEGQFTERAKGQAGEGDTNLYARNDTVEVAQQEFDDFGARAAFDHELANPRNADGHQRKLRSREETVQRHEQEHTD